MWLNERIVDSYDLHIPMLNAGRSFSRSFFLAGGFRKSNGGATYALRNTILPMRPKPLMPTSVSDIIASDEYGARVRK